MPSWSRKSGSSILPITSNSNDDLDLKYHSKPSPPRRRSATQPQGLRRWIWFFLLANICAVLFFMFASAWYFPPDVSDSVVRQALSQGESGFRQDDVTEEPTTTPVMTEPSISPEPTSDAEIGGGGGDALISEAPAQDVTPVVQTPETPLELHLEKPQRGDQVPIESPENSNASPGTAKQGVPTSVVENVPETMASVVQVSMDATVTTPETREPAQIAEDLSAEPIAAKSFTEEKEPDTLIPKQQQPTSNSIADLIAKMKEERRNVRSGTTESLVPPTQKEANQDSATAESGEKKSALVAHADIQGEGNDKGEPSDASKNLLADKIKRWTPVDEDAIRKNLVVWLKADKGVEVDNLVKCQATGSGDSCNVKSWTSQVASPHQNSRAEAFTPATKDQARPTFVSSIMNRNELPALFFSCPLTNDNLKLHEFMTLFFVISPAQIDVVNPFKGQKFFGNSPYGQFFFHGGKPGFLSNGGVRELDKKASSGAFHLLAYRLHRHSVEIKMNRQQWSGAASEAGGDSFAVRMSDNAALSLGNVKPLCDTNAFQGRIAEVMVYDTILTDERVGDVESYLENKWWDGPFKTGVAATKLPHVDKDQAPGEDSAIAIAATPKDNGLSPDEAVIADQVDQVEATTESPQDETRPQANGNDDRDTTKEATTSPAPVEVEQAPSEQKAAEPSTPAEPISFNPEDVFEWTPPEAVLKRAKDAQELATQWQKRVREQIEAIRGFQFGGDVLRAFIRNRKDELIALRQELFG